jgi:hypothetical protein
VQVPALLLITFGMFLGFAEPARAWRWALLLGLWVPVLGLIAHSLGLSEGTLSDVLLSTLAVGFALAGAYAGALVQRLSSPHALSH